VPGSRTIRLKLPAGLPAIADDADAVIESLDDVPALAGLMVPAAPSVWEPTNACFLSANVA